jgi:hypothetical protein
VVAASDFGRWKYHRKFVFDENHDIDSITPKRLRPKTIQILRNIKPIAS